MSLRQRLILNAGSIWASTAVVGVVGLILVPIMLRRIGDDAYGIWALVASVLSYVTILDAAFSLAVNRFVAYYRSDVEQMNRFVSASFLVLGGLAVLTAVGAAGVSLVITRIFPIIPPELARDARLTCMLVGLTLSCRMLESNFRGALQGYEYYTWSNIVNMLANVARLIFTIVLLQVWRSMVAVQLAFLGAAAVSAVLMFIHARRKIAGFRIDLRRVDRSAIRELFRYTSHSIVRSGSHIAMYSTMTLLVGWLGTAADVALYNIASTIPSFVRGIVAGAHQVFLPSASRLFAEGQVDRIRSLVKKGTMLSTALTLGMLIPLFVFTEPILHAWLRRSISGEMVVVTRTLIFSVVPTGAFDLWLPVLVGMGFLWGLTVRAVATAALAVVVEVILLQGLVAPALAPAVALVVALSVGSGLWLPSYGMARLGIRVSEYFRQSLLTPLAAGMASAAGVGALTLVIPRQAVPWWLCFGLSIVVVAVAFAAIALRVELAGVLAAVRRHRADARLRS